MHRAGHFICDHLNDPIDITPIQTLVPDAQSDGQNDQNTPIAKEPSDPVFAVCNLNTSGSKEFIDDEYR